MMMIPKINWLKTVKSEGRYVRYVYYFVPNMTNRRRKLSIVASNV